jgi:hypothetical protein
VRVWSFRASYSNGMTLGLRERLRTVCASWRFSPALSSVLLAEHSAHLSKEQATVPLTVRSKIIGALPYCQVEYSGTNLEGLNLTVNRTIGKGIYLKERAT